MDVFSTNVAIVGMVLMIVCLRCEAKPACLSLLNQGRCREPVDVISDYLEMRNFNMTQVCFALGQQKECYGDCLPILSAMPFGGSFLKVGDYLCDMSRRDTIQEAVSSAECLANGTIDNELDDIYEMCWDGELSEEHRNLLITVVYFGDQSDHRRLCPVVNNIISCLASGIGNICGNDLIPILTDIMHIGLNELLNHYMPDCVVPVAGVGLPSSVDLNAL